MEDWDDYKFILAVGRHGGLSAAARSLGVNHSTVSRRISSVETQLGVRLFDRLNNGFTATTEGQQAIEAASSMEEELHTLNRQIASKDKQLAGPLRITTPQLIFQSSVSKIVSKFSKTYPNIDITVSAANENLNLSQREADIAIRVGNAPDPNLFGRRVTKQNRGYFVSKDYLSKIIGDGNVSPNPANVRSVNFLWWGDKVPKDILIRYPNATVGIKLDDMIAVHSAVKEGLGIGRMPCFLGDTDASLARVPGLPISPYWDIWILTHPDLQNNERIRTFMRFAALEFRKNETLYLGN